MTRYDSRPWPGMGEDFEVPDWEGALLVKDGMAVFIRDSPVEEVLAPAAPVSEPASTAAGPVAEPVVPAEAVPALEPATPELVAPVAAEPEAPAQPVQDDVQDDVPEPEAPPPPKTYAPKADWVDYAMAHGASEDEANLATKDLLIQVYGGRL